MPHAASQLCTCPYNELFKEEFKALHCLLQIQPVPQPEHALQGAWSLRELGHSSIYLGCNSAPESISPQASPERGLWRSQHRPKPASSQRLCHLLLPILLSMHPTEHSLPNTRSTAPHSRDSGEESPAQVGTALHIPSGCTKHFPLPQHSCLERTNAVIPRYYGRLQIPTQRVHCGQGCHWQRKGNREINTGTSGLRGIPVAGNVNVTCPLLTSFQLSISSLKIKSTLCTYAK